MPLRVRVPAMAVALILVGATAKAQGPEDYPLDGIPRELRPGAALPCARDGLVAYRGELVRYQRSARIHPAFQSHLRAFEALAVEVALEVYGRPPRRLVHLGAHNCRRIRRFPNLVSEHALGNALDVAGFDFGPAPRGEPVPEELPRRLRRAFKVRMVEHWEAKRGAGALHSRFLRTLAHRVIDRHEIFRTVLGPAWPGHNNHFHLDYAPYRVVQVFD